MEVRIKVAKQRAENLRDVSNYSFSQVAYPNPYPFRKERGGGGGGLKIVVIVGSEDTVNPPEQVDKVVRGLSECEFEVEVVEHGGAHSFPTENEDVCKVLKQVLV